MLFYGYFLSWRKPVGSRIMRILWRDNTTSQSENLSEQTDDKKGKQQEDTSREQGVESQLRAAAQRGYPEDTEDPMGAPPYCDIRQSWRVLELPNRDLSFRPTDMSWNISRTIVQGHPRNRRPNRTLSRRPRSRRRSREAMLNGIIKKIAVIIGHVNNQ